MATVKLTLALATLGLGLLLSASAKAATFTWTNGTGDASWNTTSADWNGGNWSNSTASIALFGSAATPGTITVSGSMTLGGITFSAGGYDLASGTLGFGGNAGTLTMSSGGEIDSRITGTAGLTVSGSGGVLTLGDALANTISGASYLGTSGGTINYAGSSGTNAFGTSTLNYNGVSGGNYTLTFNGSNALSLANSLSLGSLGVLNLAGSEVTTFSKGFLAASGGTLAVNDTGGVAFSGSTYSFGSGGIQTITGGGNLTISGSLTGANLNYGGTAILKLSGANTLLTGGTIDVNGSGTLQLGSNGALGAASENISIAGGSVLDLNGQNITKTNPLTISGTGSGGGALISSNGTASYAGSVTLGGATSLGGSNNLSLSGPIGDGGNAYALTKVGGGNVVLAGSETYTGITTISAGTLQIGSGGVAGWLPNSTITDNATLAFRRGNTVMQGADFSGSPITGNGGLAQLGAGMLVLTASNTYTGSTTVSAGTLQLGDSVVNNGYVQGNILNNAAVTFANPLPQTYTGTISGSGGLAKVGTGTLTLAGTNNYVGTTVVDGGTLQLGNGGSISSTSEEYLGNTGTGTFTQSGGTNNVGNGGLYLGYSSSSSGTYNLSGSGVLSAGGEDVGLYGSGTFIQSGGTNKSGGLSLGYGNGSQAGSGSYNLSGLGVLSAGTEYVGDRGSGTFTQSGGTNTITFSSLDVGNSAGGSYNLSGSGLLFVSASGLYAGEYVGYAGPGTFTQSGGTNNLGFGNFRVGCTSAGGSYTLSGSGLLSASVSGMNAGEYVGSSGPGTFAQSGGTNNIGSSFLYLGCTSAGGSYTLSGSGLLSAAKEYVGFIGPGTFTQSGGTNNPDSGYFYVGFISASGSYNLSGSGVLSAAQERVGYSGPGTFTQSGGTNTVTDLFLLGGTGTYNLTGGALIVSGIQSSGTFNLGGGILAASAGFSTSQAMTLTGSGGNGNIDTGGNVVTLSGILSGPGGLNVLGTGILTLTASNTYGGSTMISAGTLQVGNGGSGASIGGTSGVFDNASLVFNHGDAVMFSPSISGTGSLTQIGAGVLTLAGSNTYSGTTTVAGGALKLDFSQTGAPTANIINNANNGSPLVLGGGTLAIQGSANSSNSQQFNGLTVNPGCSAILLSAGPSNPLLLSLGGIARYAGSTVDFTLPNGTQSAANGITTTNSNTNGILGGYATVGGTDWACSSGAAGNITAYTGYTYSNLGAQATGSTLNVSPTGAQTAITSAVTFNTLNLTTSASGVTMTGSGSLTLVGGGLIGNNSAGTISGGTLAGSASGELTVITPANLTICSVIADNGGATALTKAGPAMLTLTGKNIYSGGTMIGAGILQVGNGGATGTLGTGTVTNNSALVFDLSGVPTFGGAIGGVGSLTQTGTGILTLTGESDQDN